MTKPAPPPEPAHRSPLEGTAPAVTAPPRGAAGARAVVSATGHALRMGATRGAKTLLRLNQQEGFDCPGCAWPEPTGERSFAEFCENGAKHVADEATPKRASPSIFATNSLLELARLTDVELNALGRLTHPLVLDEGATHYRPIPWDEAFALIADQLRALASPDQAIFYTSGRTSNEAAFLYQLFVREFGTNNLPDCSNMCHESSGLALTETLGWGKGSVQLEDFEVADAIFVFGQNPGSNHPRMLVALEKAARRGATIVAINPLVEAGLVRFAHPQDVSVLGRGTELARLYLTVRIGGDAALLKGIMKEMLDAERARPGTVFDHAFIDQHTVGLADLVTTLDAFSWERVVAESGVSREDIARAASVAMRSERTIACWAMGLTQHRDSVATIRDVVNFLLLKGNVGRPGAGVCPVRGHSNVQGDRTMGVWEQMPESCLAALDARFGIRSPRGHGHDTIAAIEAMLAGDGKVFFALGGNFLQAAPDTDRTAEALARTELTVHVSTKPSRAHLVHGRRALILPCLTRSERDDHGVGNQFVTTEDSMGIVHASRGHLEPASTELLSEPVIVARLARATLGATSRVPWEALSADYDETRRAIAAVVPGFHDFAARVRRGPFTLPHPVRSREFRTVSGKAMFTANAAAPEKLGANEFVMMTIRSHDQFNTTVYSNDDRYRGLAGGRRVVLMNESDMAEANLSSGQLVDIVSHFRGETRRARQFRVVAYRIPRRCVATYYPEANALVPLASYAEGSRTPTSKSVIVTLEGAS